MNEDLTSLKRILQTNFKFGDLQLAVNFKDDEIRLSSLKNALLTPSDYLEVVSANKFFSDEKNYYKLDSYSKRIVKDLITDFETYEKTLQDISDLPVTSLTECYAAHTACQRVLLVSPVYLTKLSKNSSNSWEVEACKIVKEKMEFFVSLMRKDFFSEVISLFKDSPFANEDFDSTKRYFFQLWNYTKIGDSFIIKWGKVDSLQHLLLILDLLHADAKLIELPPEIANVLINGPGEVSSAVISKDIINDAVLETVSSLFDKKHNVFSSLQECFDVALTV